MKIQLPDNLVARLRREYPRCLIDAIAVGDFTAALVEQHLAMTQNARRAIDDSRTVSAADLTPVPSHST